MAELQEETEIQERSTSRQEQDDGEDDSGQGQSDCIKRETTSTVEPTHGRTRASHSRDPAD